MKNISQGFIAWLAANPSCIRVDLLEIDLPNGQTLRACMGGSDLTWNGNLYPAVANGAWSRGAVTSEAMRGELKSNSISLAVIANETVIFPGSSTPLTETFALGVWDAAKVTITTIYMPLGQWGTVEGSMVLFGGMISDAQQTGRSKGTLTAQDWLYLADQEVPKRLIQPSCPWTFGDSACTFPLTASYGFANTVSAGVSGTSIPAATAWPSTDARGNSLTGIYGAHGSTAGVGYFAGGKLKWTSGQNSGFWSHIQSQSGQTLTLAQAPPFPVAQGDGFTAYPGCQKTLSDCKGRWGNQANFGGMPFVPPPEHSV